MTVLNDPATFAQQLAELRDRLPECGDLIAGTDGEALIRASMARHPIAFEGLRVYVSPWVKPSEWRLMCARDDDRAWMGRRMQ